MAAAEAATRTTTCATTNTEIPVAEQQQQQQTTGRKRKLSSCEEAGEQRICEWSACAEIFLTLDELTRHLLKSHLNNRTIDFHCRWGSCSVILDGTDALITHLTNHLGQRLIHGCRWANCGQRFASFDELTDHLSEEHVGAGRSEYSCEWEACDRRSKVFTQRQKVMRHIQTHTGKYFDQRVDVKETLMPKCLFSR